MLTVPDLSKILSFLKCLGENETCVHMFRNVQ